MVLPLNPSLEPGKDCTTSTIIESYWQAFQDQLPAESPYRGRGYVAEGWGDSPALADELGALIAAGTKTATCSALWEWEADGEALPAAGLLTVVLDGADRPLCIVETTEVTVRRYCDVDAPFAHAEGEGDRSLAYWRAAHWRFFGRTLGRVGREPTEEMPLVCERFRVIYRG